MNMNLQYFFFQAWYPAQAVIEASVAERRVHKWYVDQRPNTTCRYTIVTRDETAQELEERLNPEDDG